MNKAIVATWFMAAVITCSASAADERRPFSINDLMSVVGVGGNFHLAPDGYPDVALMSPDGSEVLFSKSRQNMERNTRDVEYFFISAEGGKVKAFEAAEGGANFQYSPHGDYVSFTRRVEEQDQLFLYTRKTGRIRQLTDHATSIETYKWAPDEARIFFAADDARSPDEQNRYEMGENWFSVDDGSNGRIAARWRNLWVIELRSKQTRQLTDAEFIIDALDVSSDESRIAFVARPDNKRNYPHTAELYAVEADGSELTRLTDNLAPEALPLWSPDGKMLAYHAPDDKEYRLTKGYLWVMDFEAKTTKKLNSQNLGDITDLVWDADGRSLLFTEQQGMNTNVFRLNTRTDEMSAVTDVVGAVRALGYSRDRSRMVYSYTDFNTPMDIFISPTSEWKPTRLTNANPWISEEIELADFRVIRWQNGDGMEIEGMLGVPDDYDQAKDGPIPLLLQIHGGPNLQWANEFYSDAHFYAGMGFAVLGINIRGSGGYGEPLLRALINDIGGGEYEDLMSGVDHVIEMGIADPDRLALRGWSWGGVLGSWTVTQTQRFKAASIGAPVVSWLSEMGPGFNWDLTEWYMENSHWDDQEGWRAISPITHVQNVTTPTIIFHGDDDWYSSYNQSLIWFTGLRDIGKAPTRFISYPGRGHDAFDPWAQKSRYDEEAAWFKKYVDGLAE